MSNSKTPGNSIFDVVIIGAGPTGLAGAIEAQKRGLTYVVLEKGCVTNSIFHFPAQMIFFTTPELLEIGGLPLVSDREKPSRNEALKYYRRVVGAYGLNVHQYEEVLRVEKFRDHAFRTITPAGTYESSTVTVATGYYDNPNLMNVPGEQLPHVSHYFTEAHPFYDRDVVVIGGKNSAAEAALELFRAGARVTLVHRGEAMGTNVKYWVRPDIENRFKAGEIRAYFNTCVTEITPVHVKASQNDSIITIPAQQVFALTGYHSSTRFFDQLGVKYDSSTLRPQFDPETLETNVSGVYLAGSVIGGRHNGDIFIENGRFHGAIVMEQIGKRREIR
jgi:thioredoxin reductase (NADPH)